MSPCLEYDCKSLLRLVLIQQGWRSHEQLEYRGCLWWAISQWKLDIMNLHIMKSGVSMKIEVARRFEKSNRLHPKEAFTPLLLEGSGGLYSLKISKFWCPKMRSPVFKALNWVQKRVYFLSIWTSKCTVSFKYEAKSLSRSSKLNFNKSFDRIFLYFITLFPASNKELTSLSKVPDAFCQSSVLIETRAKSSVNNFFTPSNGKIIWKRTLI